MSSNGGGGSNLLDMGLMIAAGVAAPELAPELLDAEGGFMGLTGTAATTAAGADRRSSRQPHSLWMKNVVTEQLHQPRTLHVGVGS